MSLSIRLARAKFGTPAEMGARLRVRGAVSLGICERVRNILP